MNDIAIVIHTCDFYSWIWDGFFHYFNNHFPFNSYNCYFCNETINYSTNIIQIKTDNGSWSDRLKNALLQIQSPNILYLQEDFLILNTNEKLLSECIDFHINNKNDITKLGIFINDYFKIEPTNYQINNYPVYHQSQYNNYYIMSHQPIAIFNTKFLLQTLNYGYDPKEHEIYTSKALNKGELKCQCYCVGLNNSSIINYIHAIKNGKILPEAQDKI